MASTSRARSTSEKDGWAAADATGSTMMLWWNFVGRSSEEIVQAREDWEKGSRFGDVHGYDGARLAAPQLPAVPLKPRGRAR